MLWKVIVHGEVEDIEARTPLEALSLLFEALVKQDDTPEVDRPTWPGFGETTLGVLPVWDYEDLRRCEIPLCTAHEVSPGLGLCKAHIVCPFCGNPYHDELEEDAPPGIHPFGVNLRPYLHHVEDNGTEVVDTEMYCDRCDHRYSKRHSTNLVQEVIAYYERVLPPPARVYGRVKHAAQPGEPVVFSTTYQPDYGEYASKGEVAGVPLEAGQIVRRKSWVSAEMIPVPIDEL